MNALKTRFREDHGVVAVTVAILMIVFLGLAALAVDMGYHYTVKRQLQAAADAGALAGVRELMDGSDDATILGVASDYANLNADNPGDGLAMVEDEPLTEIGPNFVRVTVEKQSPQFFGRMFVPDDPVIQATAEARVAYVTGMRGLIPVGLPILRADRVYAWVDGDTARQHAAELNKGSDGLWRGNLQVPAMAVGASRGVNLDIYNEQDYMQTVYGVSRPNNKHQFSGSIVHAVSPTAGYQSVNVSPEIVRNRPSGSLEPGSVTVSVVGTGQTTIRFNGETRTGTGGYSVTMPAPSTTAMTDRFEVDLWVGDRAQGQPALDDAAMVYSVRSTFPIQALRLGNRFFTPGVEGSTSIEVGFSDYEFGQVYHMKLDSDSEVGNFGPVAFDSRGGDAYRDDLRDGYNGVINIGQVIDTETGNMTGPTSQGLRARLDSGVDFETWVARGMPRDSSRLVYVPVTERIAPVGGRSQVIVVSFAAFYLERQVGGADVSGRFVEYVLPSEVYSDDPPDTGMYLETYRLVTPQTES
jgi:hypothetical protein